MAIQQADKLLKKHKDLHCAKVSSGNVCFQPLNLLCQTLSCVVVFLFFLEEDKYLLLFTLSFLRRMKRQIVCLLKPTSPL